MTDCCAPGSGFPTAATMQQLSTNYSVIWEEICMIQQAILAAASQCQPGFGKLCTTVGGNTPMTFISGVSSVDVVDGGLEYYQDTPSVQFIPPVGVTPAFDAAGTVQTNGSSITGITVTVPGSGYEPVSATVSVSSLTGVDAVIFPLVNAAGQIVNLNIQNGGTGYTLGDTVTATRAILPNIAYTDASFIITSVGVLGEILGISILNPGNGYEDSVTTLQIVSTLNTLLPYPTGSGFFGDVLTNISGEVTGVVVANSGAGYGPYLPYLSILDVGTGATTTVALTGSSVDTITVDTSGTQYTSGATGTVFNPPTALAPNPPAAPAVVTINVTENTFGTNPNLYWMVWAGATSDKVIQLQLNSVVSHFTSLGYTIIPQSNPATGSTLQWRVCW